MQEVCPHCGSKRANKFTFKRRPHKKRYKMSQHMKVNGVPIDEVTELNDCSYDAVVIVTVPGKHAVQLLEDFLTSALEVDHGLAKIPAVLQCPRVSGKRLIVSPVGKLSEYDDIRIIGEAAKKGVERAIEAGSRKPIFIVQPMLMGDTSDLVMLLGALEALYVPIQIRELKPQKQQRLLKLGVYGEGVADMNKLLTSAINLEISRSVARDIGDGDPERMSPSRIAEYVIKLFENTDVSVNVLADQECIQRDYPLFAAVDRGSAEGYKGCIVTLDYVPTSYEKTVMLVGKGVTYDTGGHDLKVHGSMAGMSRDKCGAAAVVGFIKACHLFKPRIKVIGMIGLVRNSIGPEAYVADELIVSRNGKTVRIGNTDAEGRMIMGDLLAEMHEMAANEVNPHIYSIATLTGHVVRTYGVGYTACMDNHVARARDHGHQFHKCGEQIGDLVEVSRIRREDFHTHQGKSFGDDVLQALTKPSTETARGHQGPMAFLMLVSGLDTGNIPYSHLDIAGSGGMPPNLPTAAPLLALSAYYKLVQL